MDVRSVDLNLLVAFDAMIEHRSVTRAGEAIGLSQPAMSAAVSRLRLTLGDPLFVRTGTQMLPTPRATEIAASVHEVLQTINRSVLAPSTFDPSVTERHFTLIMPDIGETSLLPRILHRFSGVAPRAGIATISRPPQIAAEVLESGAADLAIGYYPDLDRTGFDSTYLFDNPYVCIVRIDHPSIADTLDVDAYLAASHAVARPGDREHLVDQVLRTRDVHRRIAVELSHFTSLLPVIERSDLVATVPRDLAEMCTRYARIRVLPMPIKVPSLSIRQYWHRRVDRDPASVWLRGLVAAVLATG
jgi:DNA-binding transcriptional LysR family regulator